MAQIWSLACELAYAMGVAQKKVVPEGSEVVMPKRRKRKEGRERCLGGWALTGFTNLEAPFEGGGPPPAL